MQQLEPLKLMTGVDVVFASVYFALACVVHFYSPSETIRQILLTLVLVEFVFLIFGRIRYVVLNQLPTSSYPNQTRIPIIMQRFLELSEVFGMEDFITGWFLNSPYDSIYRGNVEELVSYGFYSKTLSSLDAPDKKSVQQFVNQVEERWEVKFPEGHNSSIKYMAHIWEPLKAYHKPLLVYVGTEISARLAHLLLWLSGCKHTQYGGFSCWVYNPDSPTAAEAKPDPVHVAVEHALDVAVTASSTVAASITIQHPHEGQQYHLDQQHEPPHHHHAVPHNTGHSTAAAAVHQTDSTKPVPIVFIHGIGFGCLPYLHFLRSLMKQCPAHPLIVMEVPQVALRMCWKAVHCDDVAAAAVAAVKLMGYDQACFIGHSYGTFCVSRIQQSFPKAVHSIILLDPVCLLVCYPQLVYNFIYRTVTTNNFKTRAGLTDMARFTCSRDLTISQALSRKFFWTDVMLWPQDINHDRALIVLSGQDDLVPSELVQRHFELEEHPAQVMYHPDLGHGGFLLERDWMNRILVKVKEMVESTD